mgnify:CR=1 FL=1
MKFKAFKEKVKELCKKAGMKTLIAVCAVVVLAGVVALNFILTGKVKETGKIGIDLSSTDTAESASTLEPNEVADYFAAISLQRKQARDEAKEVLLTVAESATAIDEVKEITDINKLAAEIEQEANIESLVQSKGFAQCVAVISDEKCSVIVESNGLLPGECAQISEIVYEQAGIIPENLKIIEKAS